MNFLGDSRRRSERRRAAHRPAARWLVSGFVQGIGLRLSVYRSARSFGLTGWVRVFDGQLEIVAAGPEDRLQAFELELLEQAHGYAKPHINRCEPPTGVTLKDFRILSDDTGRTNDFHLPPGTPG